MALLSYERTRHPRTSLASLVMQESLRLGCVRPSSSIACGEANRLRHGSRSTEKSYVGWIRRYILFPVKTARALASSLGSPGGGTLQIQETDDIVDLRRLLPDERPYYADRSRAVLPLPFFYREQDDIGDERLKYRCSIDTGRFNEGTYSVRFFLFPKKRNLVRSTQSLFYVADSAGTSVG